MANSSSDIVNTIEHITGKSIAFLEYDLTNVDLVDKVFSEHSIDWVVHLAGYKSVNGSLKEPLVYYENNILSTLNLLKVMEKHGCYNLIFSSSSTVYGVAAPPFTEDTRIGNCIPNPYGKTKYMIEEMLSDMCVSNPKWNIISLRYFNPVGSHKSGLLGDDALTPTNLMPIIANVAIENNTEVEIGDAYAQLQVFGYDYSTPDGTPLRDYVHVVDLAMGHVRSIAFIDQGNGNGYNTFNLGLGRGVSVLDMVTTFERVNKVTIPYTLCDRRGGDVPISYCTTTKAHEQLDWYPDYNLEDMCIDSWRFVKNKHKISR